MQSMQNTVTVTNKFFAVSTKVNPDFCIKIMHEVHHDRWAQSVAIAAFKQQFTSLHAMSVMLHPGMSNETHTRNFKSQSVV